MERQGLEFAVTEPRHYGLTLTQHHAGKIGGFQLRNCQRADRPLRVDHDHEPGKVRGC
jgi:hypothetical protein